MKKSRFPRIFTDGLPPCNNSAWGSLDEVMPKDEIQICQSVSFFKENQIFLYGLTRELQRELGQSQRSAAAGNIGRINCAVEIQKFPRQCMLLAVNTDCLCNTHILGQWEVSTSDIWDGVQIDPDAFIGKKEAVVFDGVRFDFCGDIEELAVWTAPNGMVLSHHEHTWPILNEPSGQHAPAGGFDLPLNVPVAVFVGEKWVSGGHDSQLAATAYLIRKLAKRGMISRRSDIDDNHNSKDAKSNGIRAGTTFSAQ